MTQPAWPALPPSPPQVGFVDDLYSVDLGSGNKSVSIRRYFNLRSAMQVIPGQGNARTASNSHVANVRRSALIVGLVLHFMNSGATVEAAEAPAPAPEKLQLITDFFSSEVATGKTARRRRLDPAAWPPRLPEDLWRARRSGLTFP